MKFDLEESGSFNHISSYGSGFISINATRHTDALIITPDQVISPWAVDSPNSMAQDDLVLITELNAEVVILGTGSTQEFPNPQVLSELTLMGIPVEIMATPAACRTYNILASERRRVAAALFQIG